jgi:LacI family transcriptional regulator
VKTPPLRRVAVLVGISNDWGRRLVRGAVNYAHQHGPWTLWIAPGAIEPEARLPTGWQGHGIIARVASVAMERHVLSAGVPCVNISALELKGAPFPRVMTDLRTVARMAADHLRDRGFRNFAYYGPTHRSGVAHHYRGFVAALRSVGLDCTAHRRQPALRRGASWHLEQAQLVRWLRGLSKPVGVLTWFEECGQAVIDACREAGLLVPEEVAVLASNDDPLLCEACDPPLSGIACSSEQIGYQAAALLDRLMTGKRPLAEPILIEPTGVTARRSTDTLAIDNPALAQAVAFIRTHAAEPIRVSDVVRRVPFSRRQLEQEFQRTLNRSPAQEIRRVHLERARRLLGETDLSIPAVAAASGFGSPEHFARTFKAHCGHSPLKYRSLIRAR